MRHSDFLNYYTFSYSGGITGPEALPPLPRISPTTAIQGHGLLPTPDLHEENILLHVVDPSDLGPAIRPASQSPIEHSIVQVPIYAGTFPAHRRPPRSDYTGDWGLGGFAYRINGFQNKWRSQLHGGWLQHSRIKPLFP